MATLWKTSAGSGFPLGTLVLCYEVRPQDNLAPAWISPSSVILTKYLRLGTYDEEELFISQFRGP